MHVLHVVGARPNFMKLAPVWEALSKKSQVKQTLVHTGQHYDEGMSSVFFRELNLPEPDINLNVGSGTHAQQTALIISGLESVLMAEKPDLILVYGDVNSTAASALTAAKLGIKVGHVEAGLRSFDRSMPEEINRLVTDVLADYLFTPSLDANENLKREGVPPQKIFFVGNVMIDTLVKLLPKAELHEEAKTLSRYILVTLHRPSNVDEPSMLGRILEALRRVSREAPVIFPVHPRTRKRIEECGSRFFPEEGILLLEPLPYTNFLGLQRSASAVITDSGGIQEETTFLGIPCLTLRDNTERPVTVTHGTNVLIGSNPERLPGEVKAILNGRLKRGLIPPLWDGRAGERIASALMT